MSKRGKATSSNERVSLRAMSPTTSKAVASLAKARKAAIRTIRRAPVTPEQREQRKTDAIERAKQWAVQTRQGCIVYETLDSNFNILPTHAIESMGSMLSGKRVVFRINAPKAKIA